MDVIIIGAGLAGATAARLLAEKGKSVLLLEKRAHTGGNCYDQEDGYGILVHRYGPHIFHTDDENVYAFLSRFTGWTPYRHQVTARIGDKYVPVPFCLDSVDMCFPPETARRYAQALTQCCGLGGRITILELMRQKDRALIDLGQYVYDHIFLQYSRKQWGDAFSTLDEATFARVPVCASRNVAYFRDKYIAMPQGGYAAMFGRMLSHPNIRLRLGEDALARLRVVGEKLLLDGAPCAVPVIYTGPLDQLFGCDLGALPYRTLTFTTRHIDRQRYQPTPVVNYTVSESYTRVAEYKYLTGCEDAPGSTLCFEYSAPLTDPATQIPYYPIPNKGNFALFGQYARRAAAIKGLYPLGRLAQYKYYDMDDTVAQAMSLVEAMI